MAKRSPSRKGPPEEPPKEDTTGPAPFAGASESEIRQLVDDVLKSHRIDAVTGEAIPPQPDERFHSAGRTIAEGRQTAEAPASSEEDDPWRKVEPPPKPLKSPEWFVSIDQKPVGPLGVRSMREFWEDGTLDPDMLCWRVGFETWIPVSRDPLLLGKLGENLALEKRKKGDTTGKWKPIADSMLAKLRQDAIESRVALPPIPPQAQQFSTFSGPHPVVKAAAPPASGRGSILVVGLFSGLVSGGAVAALFLFAGPLRNSETTATAEPSFVPAPAATVVTVPPAPAASPAPAVVAPRTASEPPVRAQVKASPPAPLKRPAAVTHSALDPVAISERKPPPSDFERTFSSDEQSAEAPGVPEYLDRSDIMATILEHKPAFADCIRRFAPTDPEGPSSLVMSWSIGTDGSTGGITCVTDELNNTPLHNCLENEIGSWKFPRHRTAGEPFKFPFAFPRAD